MMKTQLPTFETQRLILKEITQSNIPAYQKHFSNYEVIRHLASSVPWPYPDDGVETFLNARIFPLQGKSLWLWGIFEKSNPEELIGVVHLWREGVPEHRGFWLAEPYWGKGYMTEAVSPIMDYAFDALGFDKLVFSNALGNQRSRRIKEKTGAKLVYTKPNQFVDPDLSTSEIWELTKEAWKAFKRDA